MAAYPNGPMYPPGPGYQPPGRQPDDGSGLAVAGLVLGIFALALCWVPVVNLAALVFALAGLGLSISALVIAVQRRSTAKGMAIVGMVLSAAGGLVSAVVLTAFVVAGNQNRSGPPPPRPPLSTPSETAITDPAPPSPTADPTSPPQENLLPLGQAAEVGEYSVAVTAVQLNATEELLGSQRLNQPPEGQYVLVSLAVVYNGVQTGDPWLDLSVDFVGTDARRYGTSGCSAMLDRSGIDVPTLEPGGQAAYDVCMDVPAEALPGRRVLVEQTFSLRNAQASWVTE